MRTRGRLTMLITICVWTFLCPLAYGQSGEASAPSLLSSPWKFGLAPYLWLPTTQGETTGRGHTVDVDLPGGHLDRVLIVELPLWGALRPTKGPCSSRWTCCTSIAKATRRRPGGACGSQHAAPEYRVWGGLSPGDVCPGPCRVPVPGGRFLAGGRYVFLETGVDITGGRFGREADIKRDVDWLEPFVGGRVTLRFSHRAAVIVRGDAGGFGVGSNLTWSLVGTFQYHLSRAVSLDVGYRVLDIALRAGQRCQPVHI